MKIGEKYMYTMRSAFIKWCQLHNEEYKIGGYIRCPNWFRHYIRKNTDWLYYVINDNTNRYCNAKEMDCNQRRRYKGYYQFNISDDELLNLQRAEWIKG